MAKKKDRTNTVRDVGDGVTASVRTSEIAMVSPRELEQLVAESPSDLDVTLPVAALTAWRKQVQGAAREELLEELDRDGRLLPDGELRVARSA